MVATEARQAVAAVEPAAMVDDVPVPSLKWMPGPQSSILRFATVWEVPRCQKVNLKAPTTLIHSFSRGCGTSVLTARTAVKRKLEQSVLTPELVSAII